MRPPLIPTVPLAVLLAVLLAAGSAGAATTLQLQAGRVDAPGLRAQGLQAELRPDGRVQLQLRDLRTAKLPLPLRALKLDCRLHSRGPRLSCSDGQLRLDAGKAGQLRGRFALDYGDANDWSLQFAELRGTLTAQSRDERTVAQGLRLAASGRVVRQRDTLRGQLRLALDGGEGYVEPLYLNLGSHPLRADAGFVLQLPRRQLSLSALQLSLGGIGEARGNLQLELARPRATLAGQLSLRGLQLAPFVERLVAPFAVGTRLDGASAAGRGSAEIELAAGQPQRLDVTLQDARLQLPRLQLTWSDLDGAVHWRARGSAPPSRLAWRALRLGKIDSAAATAQFRSAGRDFELLAPLRLAFLDGALAVGQLQLRALGRPGMTAAFDATLEPIDLARLCRALGWPEFGGRLAGRLPGLRLQDEQLSLDGKLEAQAFDGQISLNNLRVLQPFSRRPRIAVDLKLRRLDLEAVTRAFSFGRIEGRLDGDINGLRLLGFKPVAMDARLYTTPGDDSRHRISQRAIDNISRIGGGPSGVLSRSFLRVFDDFAYDRIGWRCLLENGVCRMDGLEPAADGGYVLVKGKWLPRIEVVGHSRRVAWDTFLAQLQAALQAEKAEIR